MKRVVLLVIRVALLAGCAPEKFKPVSAVLFFEQPDRLHIRHTNRHDYICIVGGKFAEIIRDGIVNSGEQFDCTGLPVF